jgi:DNA invertase Pin-like site-specific DNA recombinase
MKRPRFELRAALYARVSKADQKTIPAQLDELQAYARCRGWYVASQWAEVGSGAKTRAMREFILLAARRREVDVVLVWKLDRWGRSLADLAGTLAELTALGVAFVSVTEALDFTTPAGRALAGMLSVFAEFERDILRERTCAGLERARKNGIHIGRPRTAWLERTKARKLAAEGLSISEIARRCKIARSSVRRCLA